MKWLWQILMDEANDGQEGVGGGTETPETKTEEAPKEEPKVESKEEAPKQDGGDEEYTWKRLDGYEGDVNLTESFMAVAKELGLNKEQLGKINDWNNEQTKAILESAHKEAEEAKAKGIATLKSEWKDRYDSNLNKAKLALHAVAEKVPGMIEHIAKTGMSEDYMVMKMFHSLGEMISEDRLTTGTKTGGGTEEKAGFGLDFPSMRKKED